MKISNAVTAGHRDLGDSRIYKLVLTGLFVALPYVVSTSLQTKITLPGGDATSIHLGNTVCVLGVLILGGFYEGLDGTLRMTTGDLFDPIYMVYMSETFLLKLCIGLITGLVAHKTGRINEGSDKGYVFRFVMVASAYGLLFNVIFDPLMEHFYKLAILGGPAADLALAWDIASTSINAVTSVAVVVVVYMPPRSTLVRSGLFDRFK